ncbi:MAG: hypothetical protein RCO49_00050 [Rickettsia endosymbiont of Argas persicus]
MFDLNKDEDVTISVDKNLITIFKILKDNPEFINIIKENPNLFPAIFSNPNTLAFLEKCSAEDYRNIIMELEKLLNSESQKII